MNRIEYVLFSAIHHSNPNGDPDNGNAPRQDDDGFGFVTDASFKRKIRDNAEEEYGFADGMRIFIRSGVTLNTAITEAVKTAADNPVKFLCDNYFDIRTFGAVLSTGDLRGVQNAQVTGPIQVDFGRSLHPINPMNHTITRLVSTGDDKGRTMGNKMTVPFAIYKQTAYVNPSKAERTGFTAEDLEKFEHLLTHLYMNSRSAARPSIEVARLYRIEHTSKYGNCSMKVINDLLTPVLRNGVISPSAEEDYIWYHLDEKASFTHEKGMTITRMV